MIARFFTKRFASGAKKEQKDIETEFKLPITTDIHSHILPGLDDGAANPDKSLEMLKRMAELGYERMVATPHVMVDGYKNSTSHILSSIERLRDSAAAFSIGIELDTAAEYYMDEELSRRLESGDILTIGAEYLLFETSFFCEPLNLHEMIYEITMRGYRPLMAHPERYRYINDIQDFYGRLREAGVSFQVNINSFGGYYGSDAKEKAYYLSENGMVDFLGSDIHGTGQIDYMSDILSKGVLESVISKNKILNDTLF